MTPLPEDHLAARDLQRQFAELGLRRSRAIHRSPWRRLLLTLVATLSVLGAGGSAIKLSARDADDRAPADDAHLVLPPALEGAIVTVQAAGAAALVRSGVAVAGPPPSLSCGVARTRAISARTTGEARHAGRQAACSRAPTGHLGPRGRRLHRSSQAAHRRGKNVRDQRAPADAPAS